MGSITCDTPMVLACPACGTIQTMPPPPQRAEVTCRTCGQVLEDTRGRSLDAGLACAFATLLLLFPANFLPVLTLHMAGITDSTHLASGVLTAWRQDWPIVACVLGLQGVVLPFVYFTMLTVTLLAIRMGWGQGWTGIAFRMCERLDRWAMVDVLAIGFGVGYGRVASQAPVRIETGGWCFLAAAFMTLFTRAALERRAIWRRLSMPPPAAGPDVVACTSCDLVLPGRMSETRCPRCRAPLHRRFPSSFNVCTALVATSWVLVPISYLMPMSAFWRTGEENPHSILDGVWILFTHGGFWPLGILISLTSIGVPIGKLFGLSWFLISIKQRSSRRLRLKTRIYRVIDEIGRWSNLDPFTVMIFAPMVQFGQLAHINVRGGALAFLSMVVLSMVAARVFDPRMMWDAAQ